MLMYRSCTGVAQSVRSHRTPVREPQRTCVGKSCAPQSRHANWRLARRSAASTAQQQPSHELQVHLPSSVAAPVTDAAVPAGHVGLHSALYGSSVGGAEVHHAQEYEVRKGQDDGSVVVSLDNWLTDRDGEKPLGVYAVYNDQAAVQYIGYSRNLVTAVRGHLARVGPARAAGLRAMVFANKAMATREHLEQEVRHWVAEHAGGVLPPGNAAEQDLWEGSKVLSAVEAAEYADKANKLKKAMGEKEAELAAAAAELTPEQRRSEMKQAMEGGDWSAVIHAQTQQALGLPAQSAEPAAASTSSSSSSSTGAAPAAQAGQQGVAMVSPFTQVSVHRSLGSAPAGSTSGSSTASSGAHGTGTAQQREMTVASVDQVLNEVRPYLIADGGDVEVVEVKDNYIFLRLTGSCSTCASQGATMKMGIERALRMAFGAQLLDIIQLDKEDVVTATVENVNLHLGMLRGAIYSMGGQVEVESISGAKAVVKYQGPAAIGKGVQAAIKERFPTIKEIEMIGF